MLTATSPRYLTAIDLVSRKLMWDDTLGVPVRSSQSFEIVSDRLLSTLEINDIVNQRYPGYLVVGVYEMSNNAEPEEF